jgi:predicted HAD superfamily Cof-like phosphohydrolase
MKTRELTEFHRAFDYPTPVKPTFEANHKLRYTLIKEELNEYKEACENKDIIEIADAIADMAYLVLGAAVEHGINLEPVFDEVHRSNMSKLQGGKVIRRDDGKVLKGANYFPPDIRKALHEDRNKAFGCQQFVDKTVEIVCNNFDITPEQMFSKSRLREFVEPRQIVFYLIARKYKEWKYYGSYLRKWTNLNRVTIYKHSVETIEGIVDYDNYFSDQMDVLYAEIIRQL